jgi:hypothetical protein
MKHVTEKIAPEAKIETLLFFIPRVIWSQFFADFFAQYSDYIFLVQLEK